MSLVSVSTSGLPLNNFVLVNVAHGKLHDKNKYHLYFGFLMSSSSSSSSSLMTFVASFVEKEVMPMIMMNSVVD